MLAEVMMAYLHWGIALFPSVSASAHGGQDPISH